MQHADSGRRWRLLKSRKAHSLPGLKSYRVQAASRMIQDGRKLEFIREFQGPQAKDPQEPFYL
jgi:hypothetical protein